MIKVLMKPSSTTIYRLYSNNKQQCLYLPSTFCPWSVWRGWFAMLSLKDVCQVPTHCWHHCHHRCLQSWTSYWTGSDYPGCWLVVLLPADGDRGQLDGPHRGQSWTEIVVWNKIKDQRVAEIATATLNINQILFPTSKLRRYCVFLMVCWLAGLDLGPVSPL